MAKIAIVGDGPAGLSAALFLAKNEHEVVLFAQDETPMHYAQLHNYLGVDAMPGTEFQRRAREQVTAFGTDLREAEVTAVAADDEGFVVTADGAEERADYLVLAGGKATQKLAEHLGASSGDGGVAVDREQRTDVDRLYAVGRVVRPDRSQAIISAGAGATAALDILSREAGKDVHDWDTPPED